MNIKKYLKDIAHLCLIFSSSSILAMQNGDKFNGGRDDNSWQKSRNGEAIEGNIDNNEWQKPSTNKPQNSQLIISNTPAIQLSDTLPIMNNEVYCLNDFPDGMIYLLLTYMEPYSYYNLYYTTNKIRRQVNLYFAKMLEMNRFLDLTDYGYSDSQISFISTITPEGMYLTTREKTVCNNDGSDDGSTYSSEDDNYFSDSEVDEFDSKDYYTYIDENAVDSEDDDELTE